MSIYARILAALVCTVVLLGVGFRFGVRFKQAEWDAATVAAQNERGDTLKAAAEAIATRDVKHTTITQKVIRETVEVPVYRECVHAPSVLNDINAALGQSADRSELPASDATR